MKSRSVQIVCLALLLATLRLADPTAMAPGQFALQASYLQALLAPAFEQVAEAVPHKPVPARLIPAPPVATRHTIAPLAPMATAILQTPWTMPPPAFHSAALQSATGFGRASA